MFQSMCILTLPFTAAQGVWSIYRPAGQAYLPIVRHPSGSLHHLFHASFRHRAGEASGFVPYACIHTKRYLQTSFTCAIALTHSLLLNATDGLPKIPVTSIVGSHLSKHTES